MQRLVFVIVLLLGVKVSSQELPAIPVLPQVSCNGGTVRALINKLPNGATGEAISIGNECLSEINESRIYWEQELAWERGELARLNELRVSKRAELEALTNRYRPLQDEMIRVLEVDSMNAPVPPPSFNWTLVALVVVLILTAIYQISIHGLPRPVLTGVDNRHVSGGSERLPERQEVSVSRDPPLPGNP